MIRKWRDLKIFSEVAILGEKRSFPIDYLLLNIDDCPVVFVPFVPFSGKAFDGITG